MTIDQIIEIIAPYVDIKGILAIVGLAVGIYVKAKNAIASLKGSALLNETKIAKIVGNVLPEKMSVEIMPLVESELKKINENVQKASQIQADKMDKKLDALAKAIASMRNLSSEQRDKLLSIIENEPTNTTVALTYNVSEDIKALANGEKEETETTFVPDID